MSFMSAERFTLDTNILIYAVDLDAGERHRLALEIVNRSVESACVMTVQALAEFVHAVTRKDLVPLADAIAQARDWLQVFPVVAADARALEAAYAARERGAFGLFDALLLATAHTAGCTLALSEDLHDGARLDGIRVRNPFAGGALPEDLRSLLRL